MPFGTYQGDPKAALASAETVFRRPVHSKDASEKRRPVRRGNVTLSELCLFMRYNPLSYLRRNTYKALFLCGLPLIASFRFFKGAPATTSLRKRKRTDSDENALRASRCRPVVSKEGLLFYRFATAVFHSAADVSVPDIRKESLRRIFRFFPQIQGTNVPLPSFF